MMKTTLAMIMLIASAGMALAQNAPAASPGKGGMTEAQARYVADMAGYAPTSNLVQDKNGNWMGAGSKGHFTVDKDGKLTAQ